MKAFRLNRLFDAGSRRCLAVAVGHGIEDPDCCVRSLIVAAPDALQLSVGQAALLQSVPGKNRPALILRADVANVHSPGLPPAPFSRMIGNAVEQAVRLDAACVVVSLFSIPGQPGVTSQCLENILRLKPDCERYAMPLMIAPQLFRPPGQTGGVAEGDLEMILPLIRQACDLGADIVEADPTGALGDYHHVVESAGGIPVLVRAGCEASDAVILDRAEKLIRQGAAGLVYGRELIRHSDPTALTRALMAVVHDGVTAGTSF